MLHILKAVWTVDLSVTCTMLHILKAVWTVDLLHVPCYILKAVWTVDLCYMYRATHTLTDVWTVDLCYMYRTTQRFSQMSELLTSLFRPFFIEPEHILPNTHHKQPLILNLSPNTSSQTHTTSNHSSLIDVRLVLVRQCSVFVGSNQTEASEEKLYLARQRYADQEQGKRNKRCRKRRDIYFGNPAWNCQCTHTHTHTHTHTYTFYHSWQILGTTHKKGAIKVCCVQSSKRLWPSHQLAATHCTTSRHAACEIKQKLGHRFSISKWPEGSRSVLCPVFVQLCSSHQQGDSHRVHAAGRAACEIKYKLGHHFSITQFGSPTAQIPLESGSSADKRFRTENFQ